MAGIDGTSHGSFVKTPKGPVQSVGVVSKETGLGISGTLEVDTTNVVLNAPSFTVSSNTVSFSNFVDVSAVRKGDTFTDASLTTFTVVSKLFCNAAPGKPGRKYEITLDSVSGIDTAAGAFVSRTDVVNKLFTSASFAGNIDVNLSHLAPNPDSVRIGDGVDLLAINADGSINTQVAKSSTSDVTSVAGSVSNVTLLASNASRIGATISNDSTSNLFLKLGAIAASTSYTVKLSTDDFFEVPFGYTGIIDGIWSVASGDARITELT